LSDGVGDVSIHGFEALSLSTGAAFALFGPDARYVVCANSVSTGKVRRRLGRIFLKAAPTEPTLWA